MSLKAIVFDYNGVLINDAPVHIDLYVEKLNREGYRVTHGEIAKKMHTPSIQKFTDYLPIWERGKAKEWLKEKEERYAQEIQKKELLFPQTKTVLPQLAKRYKLGIISNTTRRQLDTAFPKELQELFSFILTYDKIVIPKPDPHELQEAMEKLGVLPNETAYVGDAESDMWFAKNANVYAVGITTGQATAEELKNAYADKIINSLDELLELEKENG